MLSVDLVTMTRYDMRVSDKTRTDVTNDTNANWALRILYRSSLFCSFS